MKRLRAAGVASLVSFAACATTNFVGETYPPTESVDIFFSAADISGEYRVMGRAETHGSEYLDFDAIERQLVKDAMGRWANAILIEGMDEITTGSVTTTSSGGDATPRWVVRQDGTLVNVGHTGHYSSFSSTSEVHERVISAQLIRAGYVNARYATDAGAVTDNHRLSFGFHIFQAGRSGPPGGSGTSAPPKHVLLWVRYI